MSSFKISLMEEIKQTRFLQLRTLIEDLYISLGSGKQIQGRIQNPEKPQLYNQIISKIQVLQAQREELKAEIYLQVQICIKNQSENLKKIAEFSISNNRLRKQVQALKKQSKKQQQNIQAYQIALESQKKDIEQISLIPNQAQFEQVQAKRLHDTCILSNLKIRNQRLDKQSQSLKQLTNELKLILEAEISEKQCLQKQSEQMRQNYQKQLDALRTFKDRFNAISCQKFKLSKELQNLKKIINRSQDRIANNLRGLQN